MIRSKNIIDKIGNRAVLVILIVFLAMFFTQCKRTLKNEEMTGPNLKPASNNFYVINGASGFNIVPPTFYKGKPAVAFALAAYSKLYFTAKFSESVNWNITITGLTSKAKKVISGLSDTLTMENSLWNGSSSGIPFFSDKEYAVVELTFLGSSLSYIDTLYMASAYRNSGSNGFIYTLIDDFESSPSTYPIDQVSPDLNDGGTVFGVADTNHFVSGHRSFRFYGTDISYNGYLLSMANKDLNTMYDIASKKNKFMKVTDPSLLYFNLYIYGRGFPNTDVMLQVYENDLNESIRSMSANDSYIFHVPVSWTGWKLVSVKYSDFRRVGDPLTGGGGNGIKEPNLVSSVAISLNSYPTPGLYVDASIDYVVLSQYGPFEP